MRFSRSYLFLATAALLTQACTESYSPKTEIFDDLLVVEATITNELKKQEIKLTRTYTFEETRAETVSNANVSVLDNMGNQYAFQYSEDDSLYISTVAFQAVPENNYFLNIVTEDGETYVSTPETLPTANQVEVNFEKKEIDGVYGVQITANSYDPTNSSHYYRYDYTETFKVIPPYWGPYKAVIIDNDSIGYELRDNPETRVCYSTKRSKEVILTTTTELSEDRVSNFPLRFISHDNYILRYKYSILVKQYIENLESYTFYKTLKKIAGTDGTILSPNQPGFVAGNLSTATPSNKKIIGYFSVASVSSERIFLEGSSLFPETTNNSYFKECTIFKWDKTDLSTSPPPAEGRQLKNAIKNGTLLLYFIDPDYPNIYWMVEPECTDCTTFSSNEIPDFW